MQIVTQGSLYDNDAKYEEEFNENLSICRSVFNDTFLNNNTNNEEIISVCAPGRVNLIGEHIDYNEGFVFPMAIPLYTIIVGSRSSNSAEGVCRVKAMEPSLGTHNYVEFSLDSNDPLPGELSWAKYIREIVANYHGAKKFSFDAVIKSNVPMGSGLSSSAALEVAVYTFLEHLNNDFADQKQKALLCQKAEHAVGVPCGIMDQFISTMGSKGNLLLIDCRSLDSTPYALNDPNVSILIINSNVKHKLEGSEYSTRRKQCETVAKALGKISLREASLDELEEKKELIDEESYRRGRHAITEIKRTLEAAEALKRNDMLTLGKLMNLSHDSLRDDFNVSCVELDSLVDICRKCDGVFGSRMTGGGFGGCTVTLVRRENVNDVIQSVKANYSGTPSFYVCTPCDGAKKIL